MLQHLSGLLMLCDRQKQHLNMEFFWITKEPQKVSVLAKQEKTGDLKYCYCEQCAIKNLHLFLTREAFRPSCPFSLWSKSQFSLPCCLCKEQWPACSGCSDDVSHCSASAQAHKHTQWRSCSIKTDSRDSKFPLGTSPLSHPPPQRRIHTWGSATPARKGGRNHSAPGHHPSPAGWAHPAQVQEIPEPLQRSQNKLGLSPYMGSLRKKISLTEMVWKGRA